MIETRGLRGLVPVVQTPLYEDGSIDEEGQTKLIEWLGGLPVGGYWVLGTGSEDMNLSFDKRLQAARVACAANAGKKPLILGTGFFALDDIFAFIDATADLEFDAYHVMPYHPLLGHARLDWFYRQIADYCRKPLWMYYSSNWSKKVSPEFVAALKDHPNIAGIKFSSRDTIDQIKIMALANDSFQAITAVIGQYYAASLHWGESQHDERRRRPARTTPGDLRPLYGWTARRFTDRAAEVLSFRRRHAQDPQAGQFPRRGGGEICPVAPGHLPAIHELLLPRCRCGRAGADRRGAGETRDAAVRPDVRRAGKSIRRLTRPARSSKKRIVGHFLWLDPGVGPTPAPTRSIDRLERSE